MTTPTVNVHLLPSSDAITAIICQPADCAVSSDAAVYNSQMQEVQLALQDAWVVQLAGFGQDLLCILDVWPEASRVHV